MKHAEAVYDDIALLVDQVRKYHERLDSCVSYHSLYIEVFGRNVLRILNLCRAVQCLVTMEINGQPERNKEENG